MAENSAPYRACMSDDAVRLKRNKLLSDTDWTQTQDCPLPEGMRLAYAQYRQQLRDMDMSARPAIFPDPPTDPVEADTVGYAVETRVKAPEALEKYRQAGESDEDFAARLSLRLRVLYDKVRHGAATDMEVEMYDDLHSQEFVLRASK